MVDESYFSIIFGEGTEAVDIGKLIGTITKVERNVGAEQSHTYSAGTGRFGKTWLAGTRGSYPITVEGKYTGSPSDILKLRTKLARALDCPDGPKKLQFDDQDGNYYLAVCNGQVKFTEDLKTSTADVTISFEVPDGLLHSERTKLLTINTTSPEIGSMQRNGSIVKMTLNNAGSAPAYPKIKVKNNETNGWIGIVNKNGLMEIGASTASAGGDRVSTGKWDKAYTLLNLTPNDREGWSKGKNITAKWANISPLPFANHAEASDLQAEWAQRERGSVGYDCPGFHWNRQGQKGVGQDWGCCIYEFPLATDPDGQKGAKDFRCDFNIKVWESRVGQTGLITLLFMTDDDKLICAYGIDKWLTDRQYTAQVFATNDIHKDGAVPRVLNYFDANNNEPGQIRPNIAFNSSTGACYIIKEGPKFTFTYAGRPTTVTDPSKQHMVCAKVCVMFGRFIYERPDVGHLDLMTVQSIKFQKINAERYDLVPNKYNKGSEVLIDMENGKLTFNADPTAAKIGVSAEGDLVNGSRYFSIPPGESQLEIHSSGFVQQPPDVTVEWEEAWL